MMFRAPKGIDDILPPASATWRRLLRIWDRWVERFGYEMMIVPLFESTDVFARGVGESTEVVQKQMYTFADRAGRSLTLRPEATASVVRAYLQAGAPGILKVSVEGPMFRYEQPQAGRRRQFFQLDAEYLGTDAPAADAEIIELGYRFLVEAGAQGVVVQLNSLGDPSTRPAYLDALRTALEPLRSGLDEDDLRRLETNPLRLLDSKTLTFDELDVPSPVDFLGPEAQRHYDDVRAILRTVGVPYEENPRLVRGLDYYTRTAFEYVGSTLDTAQTALGGGGRYDGLAEVLGGPHVPGVGLALGLDRIVLALETAGQGVGGPSLDVFVVAAGPDRRLDAVGLVSRLRGQGFSVDVEPTDRSVKAQFKVANRRKARTALVVGDEWDEGQVTARMMEAGTQETIPREELEAWLSKHLR